MEDKDLMENHLLIVKGVCDLYLHGMIEASSQDVHTQFQNALNEELNIQNKLYNLMKEKGWYKTDEAETNKLAMAKAKFEKNSN